MTPRRAQGYAPPPAPGGNGVMDMASTAKECKLREILTQGAPIPARTDYLDPAQRALAPQRLLQRRPRLYALLKSIITPTLNTRAWLRGLPDPLEATVVDLGCGTTCLHPEFITLDFVAFPHVDVVTDLERPLPLRTASVDAVVSISVLEHLRGPEAVLGEVARVLRPGGRLHLATPLLYPYHGAPHDYRRWTLPGLGLLLAGEFVVERSGPRGGAAGVVALALAHALAQVACLGSATAYSTVQFAVLALLSPLKLLDLLFSSLPFATTLCPGLYVVARRKGDG